MNSKKTLAAAWKREMEKRKSKLFGVRQFSKQTTTNENEEEEERNKRKEKIDGTL